MTGRRTLSTTRLFVSMLIHVLAGIPLVAYLWETLNGVLALQATLTQILIAVPVLVVFGFLLRVLARRVRQWQTADVR